MEKMRQNMSSVAATSKDGMILIALTSAPCNNKTFAAKESEKSRRFIQLASHVKQEEPSEDDDLPKTTPTENDEFPRTGVWDEPKAGKKEANKMPRAPMKSATEHEED